MNNYFGENVRNLRKQKELTQEAFADFLGVSPQAVSKWERGDTFPDITMLPSVASFFGVTTDYLLGVDRLGAEEKIGQYVESYYKLWQSGEYDELRELMRKAMREYPGDFRLIVRYLNTLTVGTGDETVAYHDEAVAIYNNIRSYCTTDSIRVWAMKIMVNYYKKLLVVKESGVRLCDAEAILAEMPLMQNGRDYLATFLYEPGEKRNEACRNALAQLVFMFGSVVIDMCRDKNTTDFKIGAVETAISLAESVYPDGDYGKCHQNMIRHHAWLGRWYYESGDVNKAIEHLKKSAVLAAAFDKLPEKSVCTSPLVRGLMLEKSKITMNFNRTERECVMELIKKLPAPEQLLARPEYAQIIAALSE